MEQRFLTQFAGQVSDVLNAILDQSVDCIKLVSTTGEIEYVNRNGLIALGLDDFSQIVGKDWASLWPEDGRERVRTAVGRVVRGQRDRFDGYCPDASGRPRWWDVSASPINNERGELTHILAVSRDVTNQVQERVHERQLREEAQRVAERSDNVAREMRHRLKNQLAVVASVAKLLSRHSVDANDLIGRLEGKLQALARAQDLLTVHRDQPPEAVQAIAQVLEASGAGERISVGPFPYCRLGDDAIQQLALILGELQTNSLKYGALAGGEGCVRLTGTLDAGALTMIWDEDCGRKIDAPAHEGSGFKLLTRLGSTSGKSAKVRWHMRGPEVEFHVRVL